MKVYKEMSIYRFEPWSGAIDTYNHIDEVGKLDELENLIDELYPEGIDETELNDLLWFQDDWLYEILGISEDEEEEEEEDEEFNEFCGQFEKCVGCPFEFKDFGENENCEEYYKAYKTEQ